MSRSDAGHRVAGVLDQALSSAINFATLLIPGLLFEPSEAGTLVLAMAAAYIVLGLQRALVGEPFLSYTATADPDEQRRMLHDGRSVAVAVGAIGAIAALVAWQLGAVETSGMVWVAPWVVPVLLHDAGRYWFLCTQRADRALIADATFAVVQAAAVSTVVVISPDSSPGWYVAAWGLGAVAGVVAAMTLSATWALGSARRWLREVSHLARWFIGSAIVAQTQYYLVIFLLAATAGRAEAAGLRYMHLLLLQPVQVVLLGLNLVIVPVVATAAAEGRHNDVAAAVRRMVRAFAIPALAVLAAIPLRDHLVHLVLPRFDRFAEALVPVSMSAACYIVQTPLTAAVRGLRRAKELFVVQVSFSAVAIPSACVGAAIDGAVGAAWGLFAGALAQLTAAVIAYRRSSSTSAPAATPIPRRQPSAATPSSPSRRAIDRRPGR
jgi:hypothetical protein